MPLFATLFASAFNVLLAFFGRWMAFKEAATWSRRVLIVALGAAFMAAVSVCMSALLTYIAGFGGVGGSAWAFGFLMGLGMFIPSNAVAVMSCLGAVWLACVVYRLKTDGLRW